MPTIIHQANEFDKMGNIAKIGHIYYEYIGNDLWRETKNQKYNF